MSLVLGLRAVSNAAFSAIRASFVNRTIAVRQISRSVAFSNEENEETVNKGAKTDEVIVDPAKDRRNPVPVETSIRYLASDAYKETYKGNPVWKLYRRNHKGLYPPQKTRKTCVRQGIISTGNPCPICRDEYLVLDHRNVALLTQFISEYNGAVLSYKQTGICQKQYKNLLIAIRRAYDYGTVTFDVPTREYDYSDWYKPETETEKKSARSE